MDIGLRRRNGGVLLLAAAALILLGVSLVSVIWFNLREQRRLVETHMDLTARGLAGNVQTTFMRGMRRFGREGRELFLPLAGEFFQDVVASGEVAILGLYAPDGKPIVYAGPDRDHDGPNLPPAARDAILAGEDWSGEAELSGKRYFLLATPARPGLLDGRRPMLDGPPPSPLGPLRPAPGPVILIGLDAAKALAPYRDVRRAAILQTAYVLLVAVFLWALVAAYARKREQGRKLLRLESFHSKLLDAMPDGLAAIGPDGTITSLNASARDILDRIPGAPPGQWIGRRWDDLVPTRNDGPDAPAWRQIELAGLSLELLTVPVKEADDPDAPMERLVLLRDRTEIRSLEKKLGEARELAAIGRLAAGVAHEIRNPLSSLRGFAQFFQNKLKDREPEHTYAKTMVHEADRLNRVVADLLFLARPRTLEPVEVDLARLLEELAQLLRFDLDEKHAELRLDLDAPTAFADADALKQSLLNLLLNSLAALGPTGGRVTVQSVREPDAVRLSVIDDGAGMTAEERDNALEPFFTTKKKGSGLGLAIVHKIMREHKGDIDIASEPGKGAVVSLRFPTPDSASGGQGRGEPLL